MVTELESLGSYLKRLLAITLLNSLCYTQLTSYSTTTVSKTTKRDRVVHYLEWFPLL